jgi:formylglycine-generating enzyme required for sulfatase activity
MGTNYGGEEEAPPHTVTLDSFYIDLYEVTNARYDACVRDQACNQPMDLSSATRPGYYGVSTYDDFPVIHVSWEMAKDYCEWRGARLPSEAEWEKAARGSTEGIYPWGMDIDCSLANYWGEEENCVGDTTAVGSYPQGASPYGALDMAGNVWEWVMDWYDPGYYAVSPPENPPGPDLGQHRVVRGGSWSGGALQLRVTTRGRDLPAGTYNYVGFRCVRSP